MYGSLTERITRSLAYMLRHQPEEFDLELDAEGYGDLDDVVCALNERLGEPIEAEDVIEAIGSGDRPRYEIVDERIRALYGHSFPVEPGESVEPPEELYVGVGSRDADRARRHGLESGRRAFLHLARTWDEAREMGRRAAPEYAVITVQALDAWEDGIDFYDRRSLFLSESIPTEFLEVGEVFEDGIRREGRGDGRRGSRDGRGRSRRGGRRDGGRRDGGRRGGGRREEGYRDDDHRSARRTEDNSVRDEPSESRTPRHADRDVVPARKAPERAKPEPARREATPSPEPVRDRSSSEANAGFGGGVFGAGLTAEQESRARRASKPEPPLEAERAPRPEPQREPEPRPEPERAPRPERERAPRPEPERAAEPRRVEEPAQDSESGGFGAGIL